jgi:hypothetical protein
MENEGEEARLAWLEELKSELSTMRSALADLVEYLKKSSTSSSSASGAERESPRKAEAREPESPPAVDLDALAEKIAARLRPPEPEKPVKPGPKPLVVRRR